MQKILTHCHLFRTECPVTQVRKLFVHSFSRKESPPSIPSNPTREEEPKQVMVMYPENGVAPFERISSKSYSCMHTWPSNLYTRTRARTQSISPLQILMGKNWTLYLFLNCQNRRELVVSPTDDLAALLSVKECWATTRAREGSTRARFPVQKILVHDMSMTLAGNTSCLR